MGLIGVEALIYGIEEGRSLEFDEAWLNDSMIYGSFFQDFLSTLVTGIHDLEPGHLYLYPTMILQHICYDVQISRSNSRITPLNPRLKS